MKHAIGIDVGGTNIRIALVDENGNMSQVIKEKTKAHTPNDLVLQILSLLDRISYSNIDIVGIGIGYSGVKNIIDSSYETAALPGVIALIAAIVSIVVKEAMFWYTRHYAKLIDSSAFMADAWHHRSDAISSVGALIGIGFARAGFPVMDSVASIVICVFILKTSVDIMMDTIGKMTDKACDDEKSAMIRAYISSYKEVEKIDLLRTRLFGNKIYVEAEIQIDGDMKLRDAHEIAERIHDGMEKEFEDVKHIMIHINPTH